MIIWPWQWKGAKNNEKVIEDNSTRPKIGVFHCEIVLLRKGRPRRNEKIN